jgi:hypothetical protein
VLNPLIYLTLLSKMEQDHQLANVKTEKEKLEQSVRDLQEINHSLSYETAEVKSILSQKSKEWDGAKVMLMNRLKETERTLALVASQNVVLDKKMSEEKETLTNRLTETEKLLEEIERTLVLVASRNEELTNKHDEVTKTLKNRVTETAGVQMLEQKNAMLNMMLRTETENALVAIASQNQQPEKKNSLLERKLQASSPLPLYPRRPQNEISVEMLSFLMEEREKLGIQQELESMILEALSFDKENAEAKKLADTTPRTTNSWKENIGSSVPRVRALSRSRMPLSPTSSETSPTGSMRSYAGLMRRSTGSMPSHRRRRPVASIDP